MFIFYGIKSNVSRKFKHVYPVYSVNFDPYRLVKNSEKTLKI